MNSIGSASIGGAGITGDLGDVTIVPFMARLGYQGNLGEKLTNWCLADTMSILSPRGLWLCFIAVILLLDSPIPSMQAVGMRSEKEPWLALSFYRL